MKEENEVNRQGNISGENLYNNITRNRINNHNSSTATVKLSIDFIRISIDSKHYNTAIFYNLFNKIESMSILSSEYRFKYGVGYSQVKTYYISFNNQVHEVVTLRCPSDVYMPILLNIHEPTEHLLRHLEPYLNPMKHRVSQIENTLDFIGNQPDEIYQFMKEHLMLLWPGKKRLNLNYKTTFYRNDIRGARGKGLRCYRKSIKDENGEKAESVRVELLLKRRLLKDKKINTIDDVFLMDQSIPVKYLAFKQFNNELFINKLKDLGYGQEFIDNMLVAIRNDNKNGFLYESNVTAKTYYEKGSLHYFKHHDFNKYFKGLIVGNSFLNGDTFDVDVGKMVCV